MFALLPAAERCGNKCGKAGLGIGWAGQSGQQSAARNKSQPVELLHRKCAHCSNIDSHIQSHRVKKRVGVGCFETLSPIGQTAYRIVGGGGGRQVVKDDLLSDGERSRQKCSDGDDQFSWFHCWKGIAFRISLFCRFGRSVEKLSETDADGGKTATGKDGVAFHHGVIEIAAILRVAMDFDPALDRQDDPVFLHTRLGVEGGQ